MSTNCNDGASKSNYDDGICEMNSLLQNMSTTEKDNSKDSFLSNICANCGKEGSDVTNTCNKCMMVKYCNASCKKKHRSKHKKQCDRRIAELHDEALFTIPPKEDCQICLYR